MKCNKLIILKFILLTSLSCTNNTNIIEVDEDTSCASNSFSITALDNIVFDDNIKTVRWQGGFTNEKIIVHYTVDVGINDGTEQFNFVFKKTNSCPTLDYAYKFYDGKESDISALTAIEVSEFYYKDWEENKKFSGVLIYKDPHNKQNYTRKFWIEFTENDAIIEQTNFNYFNDCLGDKLPLPIDIDKDSSTDFQLIYEKFDDDGNSPKFDRYVVKLITTDQNINKILSPIKNNPPYIIVFEPPFTSENTRQYFNGVKNELDVFYEFESPFESYNFFLNNLLTYKGRLGNSTGDYFVISKEINGETYFGWIKFSFKVLECEIKVLETFLNTTPNKPIFVN